MQKRILITLYSYFRSLEAGHEIDQLFIYRNLIWLQSIQLHKFYQVNIFMWETEKYKSSDEDSINIEFWVITALVWKQRFNKFIYTWNSMFVKVTDDDSVAFKICI